MASASVDDREGGVFRRALRRLTVSSQQLDDEDLQVQVDVAGATPCRDVEDGHRTTVQLVGRLRSVCFTPHTNLPTLEAELYDGTGSVSLVWLGRRRIAGIEPGRSVRVRGRVCTVGARRVIYNPWYELIPAAQ